MKKIALTLFLLACLSNVFSSSAYASEDLIQPNSRFYFLQTWKESLKLFFTLSPEQKLNYLLELSDKRVDEMEEAPLQQVANRYGEHFRQLNELSNQVKGKEQAVERIKAASLRQQAVLARVYNQVPENAQNTIINAQENSSKYVAQTIEKVEGASKAQEYIGKVETIQQLEKMGQVERIEQIPMEENPNVDPSQAIPKEIKETNPLLPGQNLNPIKEGEGAGQGMQPAEPVEMQAPAEQK